MPPPLCSSSPPTAPVRAVPCRRIDHLSLQYVSTRCRSTTQLRDELERSGEYKVPLHQCNSLFAKKPARAPPPAADEDDDLLAGIFSSMEAAPPPPSPLPLVEALSSRVTPEDRSELILNCLERLGVTALEGSSV